MFFVVHVINQSFERPSSETQSTIDLLEQFLMQSFVKHPAGENGIEGNHWTCVVNVKCVVYVSINQTKLLNIVRFVQSHIRFLSTILKIEGKRHHECLSKEQNFRFSAVKRTCSIWQIFWLLFSWTCRKPSGASLDAYVGWFSSCFCYLPVPLSSQGLLFKAQNLFTNWVESLDFCRNFTTRLWSSTINISLRVRRFHDSFFVSRTWRSI